MKKRMFGLAVLVAVVAQAAERQAMAGFADFQYGTTVTPSPINPTASVPAQGSVLNQAGVGSYPAPSGIVNNAAVLGPLGVDITVGTLTVTDLGLGAYTDTYGPTTITVDLALRDVDSSAVGLFAFTGILSGQVASNGTTSGSSINNPFVAASQTELIGSTLYTVRIIPTKDFTAPGSPPSGGTGLAGTYSFNVTAARAGVPEPASIALMGCGGLFVVVLSRRRRKTTR
jgi:hypothetical protein